MSMTIFQRGDGGMSGNVWKATAHLESLIVMNLAVVEVHVAQIDVKTPALPYREGKYQ